jgi:hypothetical protein
MGILALMPDDPHRAVPLVLTDKPDPIPAGQDDIIPHDVRDGNAVVHILPELGMQPDIVPVAQDPQVTEDQLLVTEDQPPISEDHPLVTEDEPTDELGEEDTAVESPIPNPPLTAIRGNIRRTRIQLPTPRVPFAHPHKTRHQLRLKMPDHVLAATGIPATTLSYRGRMWSPSRHSLSSAREKVPWTLVRCRPGVTMQSESS